ncbi:hypothetical protein JL108_18915 [Aeromicrobium sp. YIM 150415]|uniref:hypothetical protein n=1 Tax=Aeromicrobium sp. YIM 150415 TaxID=2803912 RepID=UPI001964AF99|nr:hypothetical protein [Aeromicrobium sp. YIM 150415]MBM9465526.1 hypothetical protein [Aeromicrobium sp. YIM 150415]
MTSREKNTEDDGEVANQGPPPPAPEETPDTGEGRLAPQAGSDIMDSDEDEDEG